MKLVRPVTHEGIGTYVEKGLRVKKLGRSYARMLKSEQDNPRRKSLRRSLQYPRTPCVSFSVLGNGCGKEGKGKPSALYQGERFATGSIGKTETVQGLPRRSR